MQRYRFFIFKIKKKSFQLNILHLSREYLQQMKNIFPQNVFVVESEFEENDEERLKMFRDLESRIPNLPVKSWLTKKNLTKSKKSGCSIYPSILDIE